MNRKNGESGHGDERSENDRPKGGDFLCKHTDGDSQRDDDDRTGRQHFFRIGGGADVVVDINRQGDEFLPVNNPVAGEEQQKPHELSASRRHGQRDDSPDPPGDVQIRAGESDDH